MAIGAQTRARPNLSRLVGQDSQSGQTTQSAAPAAQDARTAPADAAAAKAALSSDAGTGTPVQNGATGQQASAANATLPQGDTNAPAPADLTAVRANAVAAATAGGSAASPNTQNAAAKTITANLPNFGIVPANTTTAQITAAAPGATSAGTVPVSGLPVAIASRALAGSNQFDIRLDPPELGRIDVQLNVDSNGQVTSHVTVDRPDTLTLLQSQQPQLERALEQAGLKTAENGLQFSLRDQSFAGGNNSGNGAQTSPAPQLVIPDTDLSPIDTAQAYTRWSLGTGVDIRV